MTASAQQQAEVASDGAGNFVVVWESYASAGTDTDARSIQARLYGAGGSPIGAEFQVNTSTTGEQRAPAVARNSSGAFVVVWESNHSASDYNIIAQRYTAAGVKVGSELLVNSAFTAGVQEEPAVAMADNGDFVVVWSSPSGAGGDPDASIQGRRWRASTSTFFSQFLVNDVTAGVQSSPAIATDGGTKFLVAWETAAASQDIAIRYFTADNVDAAGLIPDFLQETANTFPTGLQQEPAVAMTPDGRAVIAWDSFGATFGTDTSRYSVQVRRLAADGSFVDGNDVQVNTYVDDDQRDAAVAMDDSGIFVVSWESFGSEVGNDSDFSLQFRAFDLAGFAIDPIDVQANTYTSGYQWYPAAAFGSNGRLFVGWESNGSLGTDNNGFSVQGRLYDVFIFADGFEIGDTSRWSSVAP
ncbi:MAG: hypothetical protein DWQ36_06130 [Acidobacteria bacterium]|nr:MAG: hypothetical protein DWQ36_06130 [Acidobacteriota bacterium]